VAVIGEATRVATPDLVFLTVGIQTTGPSAAQALRENSTKMLQLIQVLVALGAEQLSTPTPNLGVFAQPWQPGQPGGEAQAMVGFHVSSSVRGVHREPQRAAEILDAAIGAGANFNVSISFGLRDEWVVRRAALDQAATNARRKAEAVAAAIGQQVGNPVAVFDETVTPQQPAMPPGQGGFSPPVAAVPASLGELAITGRLRIAFELRGPAS
jgi:uncharacterized protein